MSPEKEKQDRPRRFQWFTNILLVIVIAVSIIYGWLAINNGRYMIVDKTLIFDKWKQIAKEVAI